MRIRGVCVICLLACITFVCSACSFNDIHLNDIDLNEARETAMKLYNDTEGIRDGIGQFCETVVEDLLPDDEYVSEEDKLFNGTVDAFFDALDRGDEEALFLLFTKHIQNEDITLKDQIHQLTQAYAGPTDFNGRDGTAHGEYSTDYGDRTSAAGNTFIVINDGEYYWCSLDFCFRNDLDEDAVGITGVTIYSADYFCACRYDDLPWPEETTLGIYTDYDIEGEVRAMNGAPNKYTSYERSIDEEDVLEYVKSNSSFDGFVETFGLPNAYHIYYYYEVKSENGRPCYMCLSVDEDTDSIRHISITDDLGWLRNVWDREEALEEKNTEGSISENSGVTD